MAGKSSSQSIEPVPSASIFHKLIRKFLPLKQTIEEKAIIGSSSNEYLTLTPSQPAGDVKPPEIRTCSSGDCLPLEVESNILHRLPVKSLLRCQCVCKRWRDEISRPYFIRSHLNQLRIHNAKSTTLILRSRLSNDLFSLDFGSPVELKLKKLCTLGACSSSYPDLVGSCDGLLCFRDVNYLVGLMKTIKFSVHNPLTGTFTTIPHLEPNYASTTNSHIIGFGYDCMRDDYKIFCAVPELRHTFEGTTQPVKSWVYSSRSNSWKSIQPPPLHKVYVDDIYNSISRSITMVFSNNALYWISRQPNTNTKCIFSFDLGTEDYHEITQPASEDEYTSLLTEWELINLRGCLHLVTHKRSRMTTSLFEPPIFEEYNMHIWVMNNCGSNQSWVKLVHCLSLKQVLQSEIHRNHFLGNQILTSPFSYTPPIPYAYSEDGRDILLVLGGRSFVRCNIRNGETTRTEIYGFPDDWNDPRFRYELIPWIGSLASPSIMSA